MSRWISPRTLPMNSPELRYRLPVNDPPPELLAELVGAVYVADWRTAFPDWMACCTALSVQPP